MLKISGINFWPSQLESILLKEDQLGPEYRIKIERVNSMDALIVEVESREKNLSNAKRVKKRRDIAATISYQGHRLLSKSCKDELTLFLWTKYFTSFWIDYFDEKVIFPNMESIVYSAIVSNAWTVEFSETIHIKRF